MPLAHQPYGAPSPAPTVFLLHGILGSKQNWRAFARRFTRSFPRWRLITVDLRHHGDTGLVPGVDTVQACAQDLHTLARRLDVQPRAIIGHSFGGKVALACAAIFDAPLDLWALDTPPGPGPAPDDLAAQEVVRLIDACRRLPTPRSRAALVAHLSAEGFSDAITRWMTTNLVRDPATETLRWRFHIEGVEALLADYWRLDLWPVLEAPPVGVRPCMLWAGRSDRWSRTTLNRLHAAVATHTVGLPSAGHWVHVDDPAGLIEALSSTFAPPHSSPDH